MSLPRQGEIWWQSVPSQCLRAFLHFGSVPGGGGWYALKSGFGPMFTWLGTAVRFEKQGLKLRREFSRISNILGQAWLFTVAVAGLFSCRQGGNLVAKRPKAMFPGFFAIFEASQGAHWDVLKSEFGLMIAELGTLGRFEIPGSF